MAVICLFYLPSPLHLLPVIQTFAEPQAGVSPPRRSPPCIHVQCNMHYFHTCPRVLFSRFRLRGAHGDDRYLVLCTLYLVTHCKGPGRAPLYVLWPSQIARAGSISRGCVPPRRVAQGNDKPHFQLLVFIFAPLSAAVSSSHLTPLLILRVCFTQHGTTTAEPQDCLFVTASHDGAMVRVWCVRACDAAAVPRSSGRISTNMFFSEF